MATAAPQSAMAEHLRCTICQTQLSDSRLLACQHTFCLACLNRIFQQTRDKPHLICPSCRQRTPVPDAGPEGLPKNHLVSQLIRTLQLSQTTKHMCEDCDEDCTAAGFCVRCELLLCDACIRAHTRSKARRGHSILAIALYNEVCGSTGGPSSGSLPTRELECPLHRGEETQMYCNTCRQAICSKCAVAVEHETCAKSHLDETYAEKKTETNKVIQQVEDDVVKPLQSAINTTKQNQRLVTTSTEKAKADVTKLFDLCQQLLEQRKQQLLSDIGHHREAWSKCFQQTLAHLTADLHCALQVTDSSKHAVACNKRSLVISAASDAIDRLVSLRQMHTKHSVPMPHPITFSANVQTLKETINGMGIVKPDQVAVCQVPTITLQNFTSSFVVKSTPPTGPPVVRVQSPQDGPPAEVAICKHDEVRNSFLVKLKTKALGKHKVHIKVSECQMESVDKSLEVTSVAVPDAPRKIIGKKGLGKDRFNSPFGMTMCEDHVLVADRHNYRLQEFDGNGQLIRSFQARGEMAAAVLHPSGIVLASESTNHRVQAFGRDGFLLYSFGCKGSQLGEFDNPRGIGVTSDGHVVVADAGNNRLQVLDLRGAPIRHFSSCGRNRKLNRPLFLTIDTSTDHIIVSNYNNQTIEEFTKDGQHVRSIGKGPGKEIGEMDHPTGVALHPSNHLLVADYFNDRVSIFTRDGKCVGLWGKIKDPRDVACSKDGRVFVSQDVSHCVQFY